RQRQGDVRQLINHYVPDICHQMNINVKGISNDFVETLECYDWPGNVRELINLLHLSLTNAFDEPMLYPHFLPREFRIKILQKKIKINTGNDDIKEKVFLNISQAPSNNMIQYKEFRDHVNNLMESKYIDYLAGLSVKNISELCRMSGLSRSRIYQLFAKHKKTIR
ncbi:MAG: sigma-54-dependent Fis family transcriptional regulator, partial [Proteobacteria bacterium]|nr:sigma-54-dependent Fis family transcriptional regulator [Pseudomonadota bacterium]